MKFILRILYSLGIFFLFSSLAFFFLIPEPSLNTRFAALTQQSIKDDIEIVGTIESEHHYTLYSQEDGHVTGLRHHLGDQVSKAQVLAKIEKEQGKIIDSQTETRLQNQVSEYKLTIQQRTKELKRINKAVSTGVLARFKLDEARSNLQRANSQKIAAINELQSYQKDKQTEQKITQKQTFIKALSKGIVTKKLAYDGQWVRRGDPILGILSTDDLIIKTMISPQQANTLLLGQKVLVTKQDSKLSWKEQIVRISPIISQHANTKNLQAITVSFIHADEVEKSINEKVNLIITAPKSTTLSTSLPIEAVIREGKKFHILYVDKKKKASISEIYVKKGLISAIQQLRCNFSHCNTRVFGLSKKQIEVGNSDINRVQIKQALTSGIKIIVPDSGTNDNSLVTVENEG